LGFIAELSVSKLSPCIASLNVQSPKNVVLYSKIIG